MGHVPIISYVNVKLPEASWDLGIWYQIIRTCKNQFIAFFIQAV